MPISSWMTQWTQRLYTFLPLIYVGYALPIAVAFAMINPPFMAPDEAQHFYRSVQISEGHLYASRSPDPSASHNNTSGGFISENAISLATNPVFIQMGYHEEVVFDPAEARKERLFDLPWDDKVQFVAYPNIAPYPFTSYLPSAAGLTLGRIIGLSMLKSFYLARLVNAFACVILSGVALHFVTRGKLILTCLLSLPTTLFLFSSLSQDALLILYTAMAVGLLNRYLDSPVDPRNLGCFGVALGLLVAVVAGRPPYVPFILVAAQLTYFGAKSRGPAVVGGALSIGLVAIYLLSVRYLGIAALSDGHPERQAEFLFHHPVKVLELMLSTLQLTLPFTLRQFIGVFGWLTWELPNPFYAVIEFMLFAVFLCDFRPGDGKLPFWPRIATILLSFSVVPLILTSLYLMWYDSRMVFITQEQGRYYLPIAMMLSLIAGNRDASWMKRPPFQLMRLGVGILSVITLLIAGFAGCLVCLARFYY